MKKEIFNKIKIPEGINFEIDGNLIRIKKDNFVNEKKFNIGNIKMEKKNNEIIIGSELLQKKKKE
jgi:ribosomal protein L6P/L9E